MSERDYVVDVFERSIAAKRRAAESLAEPISRTGALLGDAIDGGGKLLICGNGGSAADAQHFAAELVNRFECVRRALPAVALTTDSSNLTSIANDFSFDDVFSRQVEALGTRSDVLVGITTSGGSPNVVNAVDTARRLGLACIVLTGRDGGRVARSLAPDDIELRVPDDETARIQEVHLVIIHALCGILDRRFREL